jgi:hypothetical protein
MGGECCHPQRFRQPADAAGPCTRTQMVTMLNRLLGRCMAGQSYENARQYPDVPQTHWAWKNICEASDGVALR